MFTLFGTVTSPYVRKVRIHAHFMELPVELVNTHEDAGQARLRTVSPVWRVPVLQWDGETILDSRVIVNTMWARRREVAVRNGLRGLGEELGGIQEENLLTQVDGALDAAINRFQLRRDGLPDAGYVEKQRLRTLECLRELGAALKGPFFGRMQRPGPAEVALYSAVEWMVFRQQVDVDAVPGLAAFRAHFAQETWAKATAPVA